MARHEKIVDGRKYVFISHIKPSKRNYGGPSSILVQFNRKGHPFSRTGSPKKNETDQKTIFRFFKEIRVEILGRNGSTGLADDAVWLDRGEIEIFFNEFHEILKSQPIES